MDDSVPSINTEEFRKVVMSRRSVRIFDGTPVPAEVIHDCIDMAILAPNSSNLQTWEFYWPRSPEKKRAVIEACLGQPAAITAAELVVFVAQRHHWKKHRQEMLRVFEASPAKPPKTAFQYYQTLVPLAYTQGPLGILGWFKKPILWFLGLKKPTPREPTSIADMRVWSTKSAALAAQNFMLAARAHGYDTCPMEGYDSVRLKKALGLKCNSEIVMVISVGKRGRGGIYGTRVRFNREWFVKEV